MSVKGILKKKLKWQKQWASDAKSAWFLQKKRRKKWKPFYVPEETSIEAQLKNKHRNTEPGMSEHRNQ
jgi:hypothetical protein